MKRQLAKVHHKTTLHLPFLHIAFFFLLNFNAEDVRVNYSGLEHLPVIQVSSRWSLFVYTIPFQGMLTNSIFQNFLAKYYKIYKLLSSEIVCI